MMRSLMLFTSRHSKFLWQYMIQCLYLFYIFFILFMCSSCAFSCTFYALLGQVLFPFLPAPLFGAKNEGSDDHLHVRPLHRGRTQVAVQ